LREFGGVKAASGVLGGSAVIKENVLRIIHFI